MWTLHNGKFSTVLISHTRTSKSRNVRKFMDGDASDLWILWSKPEKSNPMNVDDNSVPNDLQTNFSQSFLVWMRRSKFQKKKRHVDGTK